VTKNTPQKGASWCVGVCSGGGQQKEKKNIPRYSPLTAVPPTKARPQLRGPRAAKPKRSKDDTLTGRLPTRHNLWNGKGATPKRGGNRWGSGKIRTPRASPRFRSRTSTNPPVTNNTNRVLTGNKKGRVLPTLELEMKKRQKEETIKSKNRGRTDAGENRDKTNPGVAREKKKKRKKHKRTHEQTESQKGGPNTLRIHPTKPLNPEKKRNQTDRKKNPVVG